MYLASGRKKGDNRDMRRERFGLGSRTVRQSLWIIVAAALFEAGSAPLWFGHVRPRPPVDKAATQCAFVPIQFTRTSDLAKGKFLVARRGLLDPNFAATVVLLVQYSGEGVVGLIINRRTKVPLSQAFPEFKGAKSISDAIYLGGPVKRTGALALIRSRTKPEDAEPILADLYLTSSKTMLEKTIAAGNTSVSFHVYLGYGGWTAEQLQREVQIGGWYIFPGDAATVFDPDPDAIWTRWIQKTEGQIALGGKYGRYPEFLAGLRSGTRGGLTEH